jgi:hypothetical protein
MLLKCPISEIDDHLVHVYLFFQWSPYCSEQQDT